MDVHTESLYNVDLATWVRYFDTKPDCMERCASSINLIAGEEVAVQSFVHFYRGRGTDYGAEIISGSVSQGKKSGSRLDAWIKTTESNGTKHIYQAEVKNWSAHSLGSWVYDDQLLTEQKQARWREEWNENGLRKLGTQKVLQRMRAPSGHFHPDSLRESHRALLIYWWPVGNCSESEELFEVKVPTHISDQFESFDRLWVFSVSLYYRRLLENNVATIELTLPDYHRRQEALRNLLLKD